MVSAPIHRFMVTSLHLYLFHPRLLIACKENQVDESVDFSEIGQNLA